MKPSLRNWHCVSLLRNTPDTTPAVNSLSLNFQTHSFCCSIEPAPFNGTTRNKKTLTNFHRVPRVFLIIPTSANRNSKAFLFNLNHSILPFNKVSIFRFILSILFCASQSADTASLWARDNFQPVLVQPLFRYGLSVIQLARFHAAFHVAILIDRVCRHNASEA